MLLSPSRFLRSLRTVTRGLKGYLFGREGHRRVHGWRLLYRLRVTMLLRMQRAVRPLIVRRSVRLWVDGRQSFKRIEKLLKRARHSIVIQMFIWKDDETGRRIAHLVTRSADRGVTVHITKEAVGDVFELSQDFLGTKGSRRGVWRRFWQHAGISVDYTAEHDHAKVFVIDDEVLLLTGMNIGDEYRYRWHDYLVELHGRQFVQQYLTGESARASNGVRLFTSASSRHIMRPAVEQFLSGARSSIVLEQSYLSDPRVLALLAERSHRGVDVQLILSSQPGVHYNANMQSIAQLLQSGDRKRIRVLLYPGMVHGKVILVDQSRAFIGSTNLIASSLDHMGEVSVLVDRKPHSFLRRLKRTLLKDTLKSRSITDPPYFPVIRRLLAWLRL